MRHFAARYVRQSVNQIAKTKENLLNNCTSTKKVLIEPIYVLDPYLDLRNKFIEIKLKENLSARRIPINNLSKIKMDYVNWWDALVKLNCNKENHNIQLNIQHRHKLLNNSEGLLSAIALPNDLDDQNSSSSNQRFNDPDLLLKIQIEMNKIREKMREKMRDVNSSMPLRQRAHRSLIIELVRNILSPRPILISSSSLVRPAIVQCCNIALEKFPVITDGLDSPMCLVGVELPSFLPLILKRHLNEKNNQWPLTLMANGSSYYSDDEDGQFVQNQCITFLILDRDELECMNQNEKVLTILTNYLNAFSREIITVVDIKPSKLHFYESSAKALQSNVDEVKIELARFSKIGEYLSKRSQIMFGSAETNKYMQMAFVKLNINLLSNFSL